MTMICKVCNHVQSCDYCDREDNICKDCGYWHPNQNCGSDEMNRTDADREL